MRLKRKDIIVFIIGAFNDYGYKSAINKRLCFGFNLFPLTYADCNSLNSVVKELDTYMLYGVDFDTIMTKYTFDKRICRLLYVAGKWEELCFFQMLINDMSDLFYVNIFYN